MFAIGEFSRITGLSVKALRFYHERGLLVPAHVDADSAYRYYAASQVETARVIGQLRQLEFSLDQIAQLLDGHHGSDVLALLEQRKATLEATIRRQREIVTTLDQLIRQEKEARTIMQNATFAVEEKTLGPVLIAGVRMRGKYCDCGKAFARIARQFGRDLAGKCFLLHYDTEYKEDDADFEACFPVRREKKIDGIDVRELPGGRCVSLVHRGPYETLGSSYAAVLTYSKQKGYRTIIPSREIYLKGPGMIFRGNPKNYLTEVQFLIAE